MEENVVIACGSFKPCLVLISRVGGRVRVSDGAR
jgi:hypothetical protein